MENSAADRGDLRTVATMTTMRITPAEIQAVGDLIGEAGDYIDSRATEANDGRASDHGFLGHANDPYNRVLGDYERRRRRLSDHIHELRDLARTAGGLYLDTEALARDEIRRRL